jgi:multicomponent Na+:H+ antiporter subunit C
MILAFSITVGLLFMAGVYLILKHDLIRVVGGMVLISNAANLYIMGAAVSRGYAPILPFNTESNGTVSGTVSDPVVQALVLTAVVISFGVSALLLAIVYRVYLSHRTIDLEELSDLDIRQMNEEAAMRAAEGPMISDDSEHGEEQES